MTTDPTPDDYKRTTGHEVTCTAGFTDICDCPPEPARALLERYGLPEDVIDGVLALHGQELAAKVRMTDLPDWFTSLDAFENGVGWAADLVDPTVTDVLAGTANADPAPVPAVPAGRDALRTVLAAVLDLFPADLHPNGPAVQSRHAPTGLILRWRQLAVETDAVLPPPADRAAVLREAAAIVRSMDSDYALQEAAEHLDGLAVEADEEREAQAHFDQLADELPSMADEAQQPEPGPYRHYKGGTYTVIATGRHTETGEQLVIYRAGDDWWCRPADSFASSVEAGGQVVPRFTPVAEAQQQTEPRPQRGDQFECGHEAALGQAQQQRDQLAALVRDFRDPDPCRLDHHGYCQAHSWLCSGSPCPHGRAREVLAALDAQPAVVAAVAGEEPDTETGAVCICGHPEQQHFEDVCTAECGCSDFLTAEGVGEERARAEAVIHALRSAAEHVRVGVAVGPIPPEVRPAVAAWLCRLADQHRGRAIARAVAVAEQKPKKEA